MHFPPPLSLQLSSAFPRRSTVNPPVTNFISWPSNDLYFHIHNTSPRPDWSIGHWLFARIDRLSKVSYYVVASKSSRNALVQFTGIATLNKEMYTDILRCLEDAVRRKRPEKWRTNSWFLLHDNAPAHRSALVTDLLAKNSVATLEHPLTWLQQMFTCPLDWIQH